MALRDSLISAARFAAETSNNEAALQILNSESCAELTDDQLLKLCCVINRQMGQTISDMIKQQTELLRSIGQ